MKTYSVRVMCDPASLGDSELETLRGRFLELDGVALRATSFVDGAAQLHIEACKVRRGQDSEGAGLVPLARHDGAQSPVYREEA